MDVPVGNAILVTLVVRQEEIAIIDFISHKGLCFSCLVCSHAPDPHSFISSPHLNSNHLLLNIL